MHRPLSRVGLIVAVALLTGGCSTTGQADTAGTAEAATEPMVTNGMDVLPDDTLTPQADPVTNPVGAAITANGDPYGIIITENELDCLQPLDLDAVWNEDGTPVSVVGACLSTSTAELFTAWHRFEAEIAGDSSDTVVACVESGLRAASKQAVADDDTYATIVTECGVPTTSAEG